MWNVVKMLTNSPAIVGAIAAALGKYRIPITAEAVVHTHLMDIFTREGIPVQHEVVLPNDTGRIDFIVMQVQRVPLVADQMGAQPFHIDVKKELIGIEVKVDGSPSDVIRQLYRYADCGLFAHLILITSRATHARVPNELRGVPITILRFGAAF